MFRVENTEGGKFLNLIIVFFFGRCLLAQPHPRKFLQVFPADFKSIHKLAVIKFKLFHARGVFTPGNSIPTRKQFLTNNVQIRVDVICRF